MNRTISKIARPWVIPAFALAFGACGGAKAPSQGTPKPDTEAHRPVAATGGAIATCPAQLDVNAVLLKHAEIYGTPEAINKSLPLTLRGTLTTNGQTGDTSRTITPEAFLDTAEIAGMRTAQGRDEQGTFALDATSVFVRHSDDESPELLFEDWILRRKYVRDFDAKRDSATCFVRDGRAILQIDYASAALGKPQLWFDLTDRALKSAKTTCADGMDVAVDFANWQKDRSENAAWPMNERWVDAANNESVNAFQRFEVPTNCDDKTPDGLSACTAPQAAKMELSWPSNGRARVPMRYFQDTLSIEATVGGKKVFAILDSGAGLSAIDATKDAAQSFVPLMPIQGAGASEQLTMGLGELPEVAFGGLSAKHLPVVSVPLPVLDSFGARRPEIVLGFSLFLAATVRVDFEKNEIVFAPAGTALHAKDATAVKVRLAGGAFVAEADVEGRTGSFVLDTGNSGGFALWKHWADANGLPGAAKTVSVEAVIGAGTTSTTTVLMHPSKAAFGPIDASAENLAINAAGLPSEHAGLIGNRVFARCRAMVFDVQNRTVWLEGPCDRKLQEDKFGVRLTWSRDEQFPKQPWVVEVVVPGSSAHKAGIVAGDRLLEIGGKKAGEDIEAIEALTSKPVGTKLSVKVQRRGNPLDLEMTLTKLF